MPADKATKCEEVARRVTVQTAGMQTVNQAEVVELKELFDILANTLIRFLAKN